MIDLASQISYHANMVRRSSEMIRALLIAAFMASAFVTVTPDAADARTSASALYSKWVTRASLLRRTGGGGTVVSPN